MQSGYEIPKTYTDRLLAVDLGSNLHDFLQNSINGINGNRNESESYCKSFINPAVTVPLFGEKNGQLLAAWRFCILEAVQDWSLGECVRLEKLAAGLELIADDRISDLTQLLRTDFIENFTAKTRQMLDEKFDINTGLDLYDIPITSNERESLIFLQSLPQEDIDRISKAVVTGYIKGFLDDSKPIHLKKTVALSIPAGYERLVASLRDEFLKNKLRMKVWQITTTGKDLQMEYDHKFDWALFLDQGAVAEVLSKLENLFNSMSEEVSGHSGRAYVMTFGDKRRSPEPNSCAVKAHDDSSSIFLDLQLKKRALTMKHLKKGETSYTGVAFPVPDIGKNFPEIFMDILKVNTLDNSVYCKIQDTLIDTLDSADRIHIKGGEGNDTNISVKMHTLQDPENETTFLNCLSTVNIPLGEVFTSPVLKGTTGVLHVEESFIAGILYKDLRFVFTDGYITDYSCKNFGDKEKSQKFLYDTLIHPHETLPMGEFAIGTNTLAYSMALRHGIMNKLPVLIAEKMGPHFAIGDTCFSGGEDQPCWNPSSGKEMIARSNEKTDLRKKDPSLAYTSTHNDITIPYSSLGSVTAIQADGKVVEIIQSGRFVLPGTEYLNTHLDRKENA